MGISPEALGCKQNADCCSNCLSCIFVSLLDLTTMALKCSKFIIYRHVWHTYICIFVPFCSFKMIAEVAFKCTQAWASMRWCKGNEAWHPMHLYAPWLMPGHRSWSSGPLPLEFISVRTYQEPGARLFVCAHIFSLKTSLIWNEGLSTYHVPGTVQYPLTNDDVLTKFIGPQYLITSEATMHSLVSVSLVITILSSSITNLTLPLKKTLVIIFIN